MKIKRIYLKNYTRMFLDNIKEFDYTPKEKMQVILGKNGIGKSSLLSLLSAIPAKPNEDFENGGYGLIEIEHNGDNYLLTSGLNGSNKHSFFFNNEELNPGGTRKIQLTLVEEKFGITPKIADVMLGVRTFTEMGPSERKEWLTNISHIDYDYAMKLYNRIKQQHRDLVGSLKVEQADLASLLSRSYEKTQIDEMQKKIEALHKLIELLASGLTSVKKVDIENIVEKDIFYYETIMAGLKKYDQKKLKNNGVTLGIARNKLNDVIPSINKLEKNLRDIRFIESNQIAMDEKDITDRLEKLENDRKELTSKIYLDVDLNALNATYEAFINIYPDLTSGLNELTDKQGDFYSLANKNLIKSSIDKTTVRLKQLETEIRIINTEKLSMEHNRDHNQVTCDECGNKWSIGYDESRYKSLVAKLTNKNNELSDTEEMMEKLQKDSAIIYEKDIIVSKIKSIIGRDTRGLLKPIWEYLNKKVKLDKESQQAIEELYTIKTDLEEWLVLIDIAEEISRLHKDYALVDKQKELEKDLFLKTKDKMEEELSHFIMEKHRLTKEIEEGEKIQSLLKEADDIYRKLKRHMSNNRHELLGEIQTKKNSELTRLINQARVEITSLEHKITVSTKEEQRISDAKHKISILQERIEANEILLNIMSPNSGLIAKSITQFLNHFIKDMNEIINEVWNYSMEILPCNIEEDDLTYRFPVLVDSRKEISDVSRTSSSMREIINLAFKITSMKYLGFEDYPLFLDEYAKPMDDVHRINAYVQIEEMSKAWFSQVFMISHFEEGYSRFVNADFNVLSSDNLMLNDSLEINKVLTLK